MSMMKLSQHHQMEFQDPLGHESSLNTFSLLRSEPYDTEESSNKQLHLNTQVVCHCTGSQGHDDVVVTVNYHLSNEHNDNERSISVLESFQYDDDIETFQYEYDGTVKDHFSDNSTAIVVK